MFAPDGSHLYTFDDGKKAVTGLYFQESESCKDGSCTYSGGVAFQYNDVSEDRGRALNGDFTFNVVSDDQINSIVSDGVAGAGSSPASHYRAGRAGGSIDFWGKDNSPIKSNTLNITTSARGGTVAYNSNDFGNYLTGQALRRLGYGVGEAQLGGHINNIINGPNDYGSREAAGWLDSRTDQRAIVNGYYHFTTKNRPLKLYNSYGVKYY